MNMLKRLLPAMAVIFVTMIVSYFLYAVVIEYEEERCWQELSSTAKTIEKEISSKFQDEITKLHLMEEIILNNRIFDAENIEQLYLEIVQPTMIFSRIDVLYPDNTLVSNGNVIEMTQKPDFQEIVKDGERLSSRQTDFITGEQYVYYLLPIVRENGEIPAVLIAALDTGKMTEIFQPIIYNGEANVCIIDAEDGNYIMDSWHATLGNAYEDEGRKMLPGYEDVDSKEALRNMETGTAAFRSRTTGENIYLYFTPLKNFKWQLSIFAEEKVLFENTIHLRKIFVLASVIEAILITLYFLLHFRNVMQLEKSYLQIQKQKEELLYISYTDQLTALNNRNKFTEVMNQLNAAPPEKIGAVYLDLNGLKLMNDTKSHEVGDRYLKQAGKVLAEVFGKMAYRIGGDEFVVLAPEIEKELFEEKIKELECSMESQKISVSAGSFWEENCQDINEALKVAERKMYREKEAFHQNRK